MTSEQEKEEAIIKNYFNFLIETENIKVQDIFFKKIKEYYCYRNKKNSVADCETSNNSKKKEDNPYFFFYDSKYKNEEKYVVI